MGTLLLRNGHVIDPAQEIDTEADVLIRDGKVERIEQHIQASGDVNQVIEARGLLVTPGLVDMHVHLRDPGFTEKEDIYTGCNAAVTGGVTSLLCMPNTKPAIDNEETIRYIQERAKTARARVYICGASTKAIAGRELGDYAMYRNLGIVAVSDDGRPVEDEFMMETAMCSAQKNGLAIVSHCEDLEIIDGGIIHKGSVSEELGVKGMDRLSEDRVTAREIAIAKRTGAPIHICHVSTRGSVEEIRKAKKKGIPVTAETCPHYFCFTHEKLRRRDADYRMNPPLREKDDVEAVSYTHLDVYKRQT